MTESTSIFLHKCSLEWQVKGLYSCNNLTSERFPLCEMQWQLCLECHHHGKLLCVSLLNESGEEMTTEGRILSEARVKDQNGMLVFHRRSDVSCSDLSKAYIFVIITDNLSRDEDSLTFFFNFEYKSDHSHNFGKEEKSVQTSLTVDPVPSLESLSVDLRRLLDDHAETDVTLRCEDRTIAAHRVILSARSEVFSRMLRRGMSENQDGVITIVDIDFPTLEQLVQYIYSGSILEWSADTASRLYEAADKYAMVSLKAQCSDFMKENLTKENACDILAAADAHRDADLKECVVIFIIGTELLLEEKWTNFCAEHYALAVEIYARAYAAKCSSNQCSSR